MKYDAENNAMYLNTWDLVKNLWKKKTEKQVKESATVDGPTPAPPGAKINLIAIVIDDEVQEVVRAENRLASLLLSSPQFIELEDVHNRPTIGWKFDGEKFVAPSNDPSEATHRHEE